MNPCILNCIFMQLRNRCKLETEVKISYLMVLRIFPQAGEQLNVEYPTVNARTHAFHCVCQ